MPLCRVSLTLFLLWMGRERSTAGDLLPTPGLVLPQDNHPSERQTRTVQTGQQVYVGNTPERGAASRRPGSLNTHVQSGDSC